MNIIYKKSVIFIVFRFEKPLSNVIYFFSLSIFLLNKNYSVRKLHTWTNNKIISYTYSQNCGSKWPIDFRATFSSDFPSEIIIHNFSGYLLKFLEWSIKCQLKKKLKYVQKQKHSITKNNRKRTINDVINNNYLTPFFTVFHIFFIPITYLMRPVEIFHDNNNLDQNAFQLCNSSGIAWR